MCTLPVTSTRLLRNGAMARSSRRSRSRLSGHISAKLGQAQLVRWRSWASRRDPLPPQRWPALAAERGDVCQPVALFRRRLDIEPLYVEPVVRRGVQVDASDTNLRDPGRRASGDNIAAASSVGVVEPSRVISRSSSVFTSAVDVIACSNARGAGSPRALRWLHVKRAANVHYSRRGERRPQWGECGVVTGIDPSCYCWAVERTGVGGPDSLTLKLPLPRCPLIACVLCASEIVAWAAASLI